MKRLAGEGGDHFCQSRRQAISLGAEGAAIGRVAHQRVADMRHMDADLVRAACLQPAFDERGDLLFGRAGPITFQHGVVRHRMARIGSALRHHRAQRPVACRTTERRVDQPGNAARHTPDKRHIGALQIPVLSVIRKSFREHPVRLVGLGHHHYTARVAVEPMDDTRPAHAADARERVTAMMDQRVHQRAGPISGPWMHDQARWLVDHNQCLVLVENVEGDVLALRLRGLGFGQRNAIELAGRYLPLWLGHGPSVEGHGTFPDERLDAAAGEIRGKSSGQPLVEAIALCLLIRQQLFPSAASFAIRIAHFSTFLAIGICMAAPNASLEIDEEKPLDPAAERVRRKLVRFMVINLGILFAAVMAVVLALVYKSVTETGPQASSSSPTAPSSEMISGSIPLPEGARIISHAASGDRLTLHVALADEGEAILLYDIPEGRLVGRFAVTRAVQ